MSILFLLLSLFIGINIRTSIIFGAIESVILLGFLFYRFGRKFALFSLISVLVGVSLSFIRFDFNKKEYSSLVVEVKENYFIVSSSLEKMYVYEKAHNREIGDILSIQGEKKKLDFTTLESDFDFATYLNNKGIYYELVPTKITVKFSNPIRMHHYKKEFLSQFNDGTKALVSSILFGDSRESDTTNILRELHLYRIISNSGVFLHLFQLLIVSLLSLLFKEKWAKLISLVVFLGYSFFTFPRFVVIKFLLLSILRWINQYLLKGKFRSLELTCGLGIFFLLLDYHLAYQDSFILSFSVPIFVNLFNASFKKIKKYKKKILLSISVLIFLVPFTSKYYNEISIFSYPLQVLLTPFMGCYFLLSFLGILKIPIGAMMNGFTNIISNIVNFVKPILIKIYIPNMSNGGYLIYETLYFSILYFSSIGLWPLLKISSGVFLLTNSLYIIPYKNIFVPTVTFINVGQGDSCLINYHTTSILIDTGGLSYKDIANDVLIPYFKKNQIYDLDLVITTHDDFDHNGALVTLNDNFKIKRYVKDYKMFPLKVGGVEIRNFNVYPELWNEENDESLVLSFTINSYSFLIMGDAPIKIEKKIMEDNKKLNATILKVGHHGSKTSSSEEFIKYVNPKEAVISCGKNNKYGHPHQSVINILKSNKVKIRRTDIEGSIIYTCV